MPHPYGLGRWTAGESPTDFGFTSQRAEKSFGLMDYNARYYSPVLGRFVSPDTIVPEPTSSGGFNRYRYVRNNPLKYTDPSGHCGVNANITNFVSAAATCYKNVTKAVQAFNEGETDPLVLASHATGATDVLIEANEAVAALNQDMAVTFSNAPLSERLLPAARVGVQATLIAESIVAGGVPALQAGKAFRGGKANGVLDDAVGALCSFSYETLVLTKEDLRPIGTLEEGDVVWAYDETKDEFGWQPITAVWAENHELVVYVTIDGRVIETTPEHPFGLVGDEWRPAGALQAGDEVRGSSLGRVGVIEAVEFVAERQVMYNLTVAEAHTYFVSDGQWLVHNDCDNIIYRGGGRNPGNLTPRPQDQGELSFRDSLSNPWPLPEGQRPPLPAGKPYFGVDISQLPEGSVIYDNIPPGHVSVKDVPPEVIKDAIVEKGKFPK